MDWKMKVGILIGIVALIGFSLFMFKVIVKLGTLMMFIGVCFVLFYVAKFMFFRKKS